MSNQSSLIGHNENRQKSIIDQFDNTGFRNCDKEDRSSKWKELESDPTTVIGDWKRKLAVSVRYERLVTMRAPTHIHIIMITPTTARWSR